jgi:site-specific DNA recombinase
MLQSILTSVLYRRRRPMQSAIVYCRKSDVSALPTDVSFENQEQDCLDYAKQHGYSVYKVLRESHSGADLLHRPKIWEAIDDIRAGKAQVLLVRNFDRLARKTVHAGVIRYEVQEKAGGRVEAALDDNDDSLVTKILDVVAEAELENAVARMVRGTRKRAERKELMASGTPLFGYNWADDVIGKRTTYTVDPVSGPIVERIFRLILAGQSLHSIAKLFNAEGVPTPAQVNAMRGHGGRKPVGTGWRASLMVRIVRDPTYTGTATAYRWQRNGKYNPNHSARPANDPALLKIPVPALIDQATFDAAHTMLKSPFNAGRPPIDGETSWLRGHVYCGVCGARMTIHRATEERRYVYRCQRRQSVSDSSNACPAGEMTISARQLDQPVYEALTYLLTRREWATELMVQRLGTGKREALVAMAESYQTQLAEKRELLENARKLALQTKDPELSQSYLHDAEALNSEIHGLEQEYAETRDELDNFNAGHAWVQSTMERIFSHNPIGQAPTPEDVKALPLEERRLLLAASGLRAEVYPKNWQGERQQGTRWPNAYERVEVFFDWELDQKMSRTYYGCLQRCPPSQTLQR